MATALIRRHPLVVVWTVVAVTLRAIFWAATDRTWEDALITVAHARNAAEGLGLTHHHGEGLVHGFTSALSVLIPLLGESVASGSGLVVIRLASLVATAVAIGYAYALTRHLALGPWATCFVLGYLAVNQNHVFYGMAGMETQVAVAVLLAVLYHGVRGHYLRAGAASGLALLARPDLLLLVLPIAFLALLRGWRSAMRVSAGTLAVASPWFAFATAYYGSPVPHTVSAKSAALSTLPDLRPSFDWLVWFQERALGGLVYTLRAFTPFYEDSAVLLAPAPVPVVVLIGALMVAFATWGLLRSTRVPGLWIVGAYVVFFLAYRISSLPFGYYDWYLPPFTAATAVLIGLGIDHLRHLRIAPQLTTTVLIAAAALYVPFAVPLDATIQRDIENGVRRSAGLYLAKVVGTDEAVTTEPAGYFGYYSRTLLWDYPGLTSPTARAALSALPRESRTLDHLIATLEPPWIVLRPSEWESMGTKHPDLARCYAAERVFSYGAGQEISYRGLVKRNIDRVFTVYRRAGCGDAAHRSADSR